MQEIQKNKPRINPEKYIMQNNNKSQTFSCYNLNLTIIIFTNIIIESIFIILSIYIYGRTDIRITSNHNRNRTDKRWSFESAQATYDYLIYYRWYCHQYFLTLIIARKYSIPVIRKYRNCITAFYGRYGNESIHHQRSGQSFANCMSPTSHFYLSIRIYHSDTPMIRSGNSDIPSDRIRFQ